MRAYAFLQLALALLEVTAGSDETARLLIRKCSDTYKMLSEDWKCVRAPWPPKASVQIDKKDDCAVKCCDDGKVLVEKHGKWECTADDRRQFSPLNSSFREDFDPETPVGAGLSLRYLDTMSRPLQKRHDLRRRSVLLRISTFSKSSVDVLLSNSCLVVAYGSLCKHGAVFRISHKLP
ncbi:Protein of unknown function [Gryllus bimaculatus]|nr:Protein of unknown function [Gryllus bimaculatus]